jgi:peptidoglycan/xylan/chitin deacetylase (PgdA/CDA1 family)
MSSRAPGSIAGGAVPLALNGGHPLEVLLRPLWPAAIVEAPGGFPANGARVVSRAGEAAPAWLRAGDWRVFARPASERPAPGDEIVESFAVDDGDSVHARIDGTTGEVVIPFSLAEAYAAYVSESWREASAHLSLSPRQLNTFYRVKALIPSRLRLTARRLLIRAQGLPGFPAWPLDTSVSRLLRFYACCALRAQQQLEGEFLWFWPKDFGAAVILTHDVEGDDGIRLALELADLEEDHGFRSSFNFGAWYEIDPGILRELRDRGFEVGMHGLTHDRALFSSRHAFEARLSGLAELAERLGAVGFRSPATHRVFEWLSELPVDYDCTIPNSDPYEPQPGGCCSVLPFFIGSVVELPYTLPQDNTLLTLLGHRSAELWLEQATVIEREHGLIQCVSHPDRGYLGASDKRAVYAEFLRGLGERAHLWRALPREVASWWRHRASAKTEDEGSGRGRVRLDDGPARVVFEPPSCNPIAVGGPA